MGSKSHNKGKKKRKKVYRILSTIISFFISLCMTLVLMCALFKCGLFNERLFKQTLSESEYYDNKIQSIKESVNERLAEAGLPYGISDSVFSNSVITVDVNRIMSGHYDDKEEENTELEVKLNEIIISYLTGQNVVITDNINKAVNNLVDEIVKSYDTQMTMTFVKLYREFCSRYIHAIDVTMYVSIAVIIICIVLLILIHSKIYRALRYAAYGILSGSVAAEIISIIMKGRIVNSLPDKGTEYYNVMIDFADKSFDLGIYISMAGIFVYCLLVMLISYFKKIRI